MTVKVCSTFNVDFNGTDDCRALPKTSSLRISTVTGVEDAAWAR